MVRKGDSDRSDMLDSKGFSRLSDPLDPLKPLKTAVDTRIEHRGAERTIRERVTATLRIHQFCLDGVFAEHRVNADDFELLDGRALADHCQS